MLHLFKSIFGTASNQEGRFPDQLVPLAIERAVDGTDPRLRALPGYKKKLQPALLKAIDHVLVLVDNLPPSVELSKDNYLSAPKLRAFFASVEHMRQMLRNDSALSAYLASNNRLLADRIEAVLLTRREERQVFGMELVGETVQREVAQVSVSFTSHRLIDPAPHREETNRLLRRRAFDHLLEIALGRIASAQKERVELKQQRRLLQRKLETLESRGWAFEEPGGAVDSMTTEVQIEEIEKKLRDLGADAGILRVHLDILVDVLERADEQLWFDSVALTLDPMGRKCDASTPNAATLELQELRSVRGISVIPFPVSIPRHEFPERSDFVREAERHLG